MATKKVMTSIRELICEEDNLEDVTVTRKQGTSSQKEPPMLSTEHLGYYELLNIQVW